MRKFVKDVLCALFIAMEYLGFFLVMTMLVYSVFGVEALNKFTMWCLAIASVFATWGIFEGLSKI